MWRPFHWIHRILHWPKGAEGRGGLLSSDTLHLTPDRRHVSLMYSYPNYIPLSGQVAGTIVEKVTPLKSDRMFSHFPGLVLSKDAQATIHRSIDRYKKAIGS
jgi:phenylpropionate dioxygenase-like ring-hydroxylating dioxygenase large terminal subunit